MKALILSGGNGEGLWPLSEGKPISLLPIAGVPIIHHTLNWLQQHGIQQIITDLEGIGERPGLDIRIAPPEEVRYWLTDPPGDPVVVVQGNLLTDFNLSAMVEAHRRKGAAGTMALYPAGDDETRDEVALDRLGWLVEPGGIGSRNGASGQHSWRPAGVFLLEGQGLVGLRSIIRAGGGEVSPLPSIHSYYGYPLGRGEYALPLDSLESYYQAHRDALSHRIRGFPPSRQGHRAVFLDRDGTMARDVHFCRRPEDFVLLPGVPAAVRRLNKLGVKVMVITNQSGVGRGYLDEESLTTIHDKLRQDLGEQGARVDAIYYCPHRPEDHCRCRKPEPLLLFRASLEHGIDLGRSYMVGDEGRDIEAGKQAGCKTILVSATGKSISPAPDFVCHRPEEWAQWIVDHG